MRMAGIFLLFISFGISIWIFIQIESHSDSSVYLSEFSSKASSTPYGSLQAVKNRFVKEVTEKSKNSFAMTHERLNSLVQYFNQNISSQVSDREDAIDRFLSLLPENYRRHFSLVHRSYSIQKGTPQSPRVILYGPDAKVMMTFNGGIDETGKMMTGGDSIEVIEWNSQRVGWDFSELKFKENKKIEQERSPAKCMMCHAGTPKPVDFKNTDIYKDYLKPIFPQYPFWPGFYGSVNDVVGIDKPGSKDTIMRNLDATVAQIKGLTFSDTEELFRLRKLLDENPKYLDVVKNELNIHAKYFDEFMSGIKQRNRYRWLVTLKDIYSKNAEPIPEVLKSAPFRRTFDKEYGHYILRPNFYLSSLMTFYHAQYVANQIRQSPIFSEIRYSFLARKFNCGPLQVDGLSLTDLDPSFDLLYPNLATQDSRDRQFLLAFQYNVVGASKGGPPALPLHAWNLEGNEDIASYHYGNVYADLNEIVLWNLAISIFPVLKQNLGRSAAEDRHYSLAPSTYLKDFIEQTGGYVSRMNEKQMQFSSSANSYNGTETKFKAMPVSGYCDSIFIPAAKEELKRLAVERNKNKLPQQTYPLDARLYSANEIIPANHKPGINMVRQACEACHVNAGGDPSKQILPQLNVDWFSEGYSHDIHQEVTRLNNSDQTKIELKQLIEQVLSEKTLPVPYENRMPYGRRAMDSFSSQCENLIINKSYKSKMKLSYNQIFECGSDFPNADPQSIGCLCRKLGILRDKLYKEFYKD